MQAFVERWIQSVQVECLDHFMMLGQKHLDYLVSTYVSYYHEYRPHQGLDNALLSEVAEPDDDVPRLIGMKLAFIPPGKFLMGASPEEMESLAKHPPYVASRCPKTAVPQHEVKMTKGSTRGFTK